jgi:hypothetical protein
MQTLNLILTNEAFTKLEQLELWDIPQDTTKEQWQAGHKQLLLLGQIVKQLLPKSERFGQKHFGDDAVIEVEAQFMLEFGLPLPDESSRPRLEGDEAVIDMLERSFQNWVRRSGSMELWGRDRLERALRMIEPLAEQAVRIRELLEDAK